MKKLHTLIFFLLTLFIFQYSNAQIYNSQWLLSLKEKNLKIGVKSVHEKYFNGMYKDSGVLYTNFNYLCIYNKSGQLIEKIDSTEIINSFEVFHSSIRYKTIYTNNQDGKLIESSDYTKFDKSIGKNSFEYSANKCTEKNSSSGETIIKTYDNKDNIIEIKTFGNDGKLITRVSMKYDAKGNKIEEICNVCLNKGKKIFSYDTKGNCTGFIDYFPEGKIKYSMVYKYDKIGNLIEESMYADNKLGWSIKTKFSNFDKFGNWLKATYSFSEPDRRIETRIRVITYF